MSRRSLLARLSPVGVMIAQGFGVTRDFLKEWDRSYFRLKPDGKSSVLYLQGLAMFTDVFSEYHVYSILHTCVFGMVFGPGVRIKAVGEPVTSEGEVDGTTLIFHLDDWNQPQSVGVHCVDDAVYDGDLRYTVGPVPIPLTMAPASSPSH